MKLHLTKAQSSHPLAAVAIEYHQKGMAREARAVVRQINKDLRKSAHQSANAATKGKHPILKKKKEVAAYPSRHIPEEYLWPPAFLCPIWMSQQ